jgi:dipeptide/tripeptide permease
MPMGEAGTAIGTATVVGGLGGTVFGGWLGNRLVGKTRHPYLALAGWTMVPATVLAAFALAAPSATVAVTCVAVAQFFLWCYNGPINAEIVNATSPALRARAFSLSILAIHLLGDAISPLLIGWASDAWGDLRIALALAPIAMAVGAVIWLAGWRRR